ncbi:hypothetical protein GLAREA_10683 [Glarea lozoyensis ATCC 20868]|uniref:Uncharacterized protein n=1 Tax=Glarea lozoyensis (strain ATCC 20868 / MF5171) TaxID=1116229 RepID=S3E9K0_GLAL2|nr:uncharacterized protein GLAREA_10683 [Glarea lozoyensis ATCC 20868]EPE34988.1 hypothetical protein GLAREA_10683 [Glarea lozoyensis ATCC 20868]
MGIFLSKPSSHSSSPGKSKPKGRTHGLTAHQKATEKVHGISRRKGERNPKNYRLWVNEDLVSPQHKNYKLATELPPLGAKGKDRDKAASKSSYSTGSGSFARSGGRGGGASGGAGFIQPGGGFAGASNRPPGGPGGGPVVSMPGGPSRSRGSV